jgi:phosphoribosylglycinamide formyltransferase-1
MATADFRIGVLGSGSGSNCEAILKACASGRIPGRVAIVLSDVAGALITEHARRYGVKSEFIGSSQLKTKLEPKLEEQTVRMLLDAGVRFVALAGFMRVLKSAMLHAFRGRIVNIHPSLLPAFPGLRAWEQALKFGAKVTGCTVHFVDESVDGGPIIMQQAVPVLPQDTPEGLLQRIQLVEHQIYPEAIRLAAQGKLEIEGRIVKILE